MIDLLHIYHFWDFYLQKKRNKANSLYH